MAGGTPTEIAARPSPQRRARPSRPSIADEANPSEAPIEDQIDSAFSVASLTGGSSALRYRARFLPELPYPSYEFILNNTGSGWQEKFLLQVPSTPPAAPAPLLVVFHKYGSGHGDVLNTNFPAEANARQWYLLAPLGARQRNFGDLASQINTRAAIELVTHLFTASIDRTRIYGVGFSMGGGGLASYAARNIDTTRPMFAAICDHTGSVSLAHTYEFEVDDDDSDDDLPNPGANLEPRDILDRLFGGPPTDPSLRFGYSRFSTIDLDPLSNAIDPATDMARNLAHVPAFVHVAQYEPNQYLYDQTAAFFGHVHAANPLAQFDEVPASSHLWGTLDFARLCDWFAAQAPLALPTSGRTLADEEGRFFYFTIQQEYGGAFTPFTWRWDLATQTLDVSHTENLWVLSCNLAELGMTTLTGDVTFNVSTDDGSGDKFQLTNVGSAPTGITRDGISASLSYDPVARTIAFTEIDGASHRWVVSFP